MRIIRVTGFPNTGRQRLIVLFVITITLLAAGCTSQAEFSSSTAVASTGSPAPVAGPAAPAVEPTAAIIPSPDGYSIAVIAAGQTLAYITLDQLKAMEVVAVRAADRDNEGPTLLAVIRQAGLSDFQTVKVIGMDRGRMANAELDLTRAQVTGQTILDITNRGTCKFVSPDVSFENWIYDVSALEIVQ